MDKKDLFEKLINTKNGIILRENVFKNKFKEEYNDLIIYNFPNNFNFIQKLYHWLNDDFKFNLGICPICKKRCSFIGLKKGYYKHCSVSCSDSDNIVLNKKRTTKYNRYKNPNFNNRDKAKYTCNKKYGVDNPGQVELFKEKSKNTKIKNHNNAYYTNREKASKTVKEKYNVDNISKLDFVKNKKVQTSLTKSGYQYSFQNPISREKGKITCIEKFGVDNYSKSKLRSEKDKKRFFDIYEEYVKNGIVSKHGISKAELDFYRYLILKFGKDNIIYDYMSELYPFRCDFYIKSIDLYIELNSHWTHGGHSFDKNDKMDSEKLEMWKSKNNNFYNAAIKTWTVKDVKKRNIARENNLKYIEIFECNIERIINDFESKLSQIICV